MPLFELLVLCMLASKPIDADRRDAGRPRDLQRRSCALRDAVLDADRPTMIDAFGRAGYARYDESSATRLVDIATAVRDDYHGDLRRPGRSDPGSDVQAAKRLLEEFKGIGDTGADIFLREVQDVWTWVRPYFDDRAIATAAELGLPDDPAELASLAPAQQRHPGRGSGAGVAGRRPAREADVIRIGTSGTDPRRPARRPLRHAGTPICMP